VNRESPTVRRRVEEPKPGAEGRGGCIAAGALLGIVVGAVFTFYGLPPILRSIFGETSVAVGAAFEGDAKVIRVEQVSTDAAAGLALVTLRITTNKTWYPRPGDFELEFSAGGGRVKANPPDPSQPAPALDFALAEERTLLLRFPVPSKPGATPKALHLAPPAVRFDLAGVVR